MTENPARTADQIEADLAQTRLELTGTVNELSDKLNPKTQLNVAKDQARVKVAGLQAQAKDVGDRAAGGDPTAIAIVAGAVVAAAGLIASLILRRKR